MEDLVVLEVEEKEDGIIAKNIKDTNLRSEVYKLFSGRIPIM